MSTIATLPHRSEVATPDTWDLSTLFPSNEAWEAAFIEFQEQIVGYQRFAGTLGGSPAALAECLKFDADLDRQAERLGVYAFLRTTEDQSASAYQDMQGRFQSVAARCAKEASFIRPEIMEIDRDTMDEFLGSSELSDYQLMLERLLRYKPHTLSQREEELLAMQAEMAQTARHAFGQLHDADMKFGAVEDADGRQVELSNATYGQFMISPQRDVRRTAFHQYYDQFAAHENSLAALLGGSIHKDVYYARARGYESALEAALFPDNVPSSVYTNLVESVHKQLPAVHRYYDVRRRKMGLDDIHFYDTYVPILSELETSREWDAAVELILDALTPLGREYGEVLHSGLTASRWCDRYPNAGKQSGAFSCGSFDAAPFILMNYKPAVFNDVFTLAHEAGHSMHSHYSAKHQPYLYYDYTIFVAEVASTFNEQLLSHHLLNNADDDRHRAYLINREIDDMRATIVRQTMFAEFEKITHEMAEDGEALTVEAFKSVYRNLLKQYMGPEFEIDEQLALECFRIPHFYRAFYVYKYATGLSAAVALSKRVLNGGEPELADYLGFLQGGCSRDPLDLLRGAGVDMSEPDPVDTALSHFAELVEELDQVL
ncbi:MAG: oligoendopeptidase F [Pirellulaceae bacterium]|jgi:oligoendopeptidase F|nr:oligoendopeptidase F [Pirellulaceae bacterium]MDP7018869.1 oligoendopeptidase F [Pirellulaceae bacterium]